MANTALKSGSRTGGGINGVTSVAKKRQLPPSKRLKTDPCWRKRKHNIKSTLAISLGTRQYKVDSKYDSNE